MKRIEIFILIPKPDTKELKGDIQEFTGKLQLKLF